MAFTGAAEDRLAIRELMERYADAVFLHDAEAWGDCWSDDGVWDLAGTPITGRDTMIAAWKAAMAPFALTDFQVQPGAIEVDGDRAKVRSFTREFFVLVGGGTRHISGRYDDEVVRTAHGWRFALRRYQLLNDEVRAA